MRSSIMAAIAALAAWTWASGVVAAPGDLDPAFGTAGVVRTDLGYFDFSSDLAIQPDGKILAAGTINDSQGGQRRIFVVRYRKDGSLDEGFGNGGIIVPDRYHQQWPSLAIQTDGRIVVATRGEAGGGPVFLYRFESDGTPDLEFGTGGIATMSPPLGSGVVGVPGVAIVSGGKIVVAIRDDPTIAFARFNPDGSTDATFGFGGFHEVVADPFQLLLPLGFVRDSADRLLVVGFGIQSGRFFTDAFAARFTPDGLFDPSFGTDGIAWIQVPDNGTELHAVAQGADGSIVVGGREWGSTYGQNQWLLARFTSGGALDPGFGIAGVKRYDPGAGDDVLLDIAVTPAGIYATGETESFPRGLPLALFAQDGNLDAQFGSAGLTGTPGGPTRGAWRLAAQADGKVVVLGSVQSWLPSFNQDVHAARYDGFGCTPVAVGFSLSPQVLNAGSRGRWITGTIEAVAPESASDIDVASILLDETVPVDPSAPVSVGDVDGDGNIELTVKFDRGLAGQAIGEGEAVSVVIRGTMGSACFEGSDSVRVHREGSGRGDGGFLELHGSSADPVRLALMGAVPNPGRGLVIGFSLAGPEPATLSVFDVRGREVCRRPVGSLGSGAHRLTLARPGALAPGIYLVRLEQGEGRLIDRAVVIE